jgi:hypothetical protein
MIPINLCSCAQQETLFTTAANSQWGAVIFKAWSFRDGIYNSFLDLDVELQQAIGQTIGQTSFLLSIGANIQENKIVLLLDVYQEGDGFQIDVSKSTVLSFLGFSDLVFPPSFATFGIRYKTEAEISKPNFVAGEASYFTPALFLGEWVHKIALGDRHTLVLTTDNTSCYIRCCKFRYKFCFSLVNTFLTSFIADSGRSDQIKMVNLAFQTMLERKYQILHRFLCPET